MLNATAPSSGSKLKLTFVLGTRPEIIKLAPVILEARRRGHSTQIVLTGQHGDMVLPLLKFFGLDFDMDLAVMVPAQSLNALSARILAGLNTHNQQIAPDFILVQGDTTTAFCAAYWGFCARIPIVHIEAGLRTHDLSAPFPEEGNRQLIARLAQVHFAPTRDSAVALRREGVSGSRVKTVGNTGVDALLLAVDRLKQGASVCLDPATSPGQHSRICRFIGGHRLVLVTAHRRESFGRPLREICRGIRQLADRRHDVRIVYPVHPNPQVRTIVHERLSDHDRILLCEPLPYAAFVDLTAKAKVLLTDSGGVQEEGPSLRIPIVVMRDVTERPEGVRAGYAQLVGTDASRICEGVMSALENGCTGRGPNPFGDGKASGRILRWLERAVEPRTLRPARNRAGRVGLIGGIGGAGEPAGC